MFFYYWGQGALLILCLMGLWWLTSALLKNAGVIDIGWSVNLSAVIYFYFTRFDN